MRVKNILSVDVEDWFCVEVLANRIRFGDWNNYKSRILPNLLKILSLLKKNRTFATFFVLGWIAEKFPEVVQLIKEEGHEIASHGFSHRLVFKQTKEEFTEDIRKSKEILEQISGEKVIGFRAPSFSIIESSFWALDILASLGIKYDSSIFPIKHMTYGIPDAPRFPFVMNLKNGNQIKEFPLTTMKILGRNFPAAGGAYLRIFPYWYTKMAIKNANRHGKPAIIYFHPWELDPHFPKLKLPFSKRFRLYHNISTTERKLCSLFSDFEFGSFKEVGGFQNA
jgi:polysaccharide deacetylase family protein (PEP-CTERM system associated)